MAPEGNRGGLAKPDRRMLIHVGLHKTGTTFLNHTIFSHLPGVRHLGKPFGGHDPLRLLIEEILYKPYGQMDVDAARTKVDSLLQPFTADGSLITIADGRLSTAHNADRYLIAERMRQVFGPAQIIVTLRRQQDMLAALYYQALGTDRAHLKYADWVQQFQYHRGRGSFNVLNYLALVDAYADAFQRENVHVFLYEQLQVDRQSFARSLAHILGVEAESLIKLMEKPARNARMSQAHAALLRRPVLARIARAARSGLPEPVLKIARRLLAQSGRASTDLPKALEESIMAEPRETNRLLARKYDLPLASYGYPL